MQEVQKNSVYICKFVVRCDIINKNKTLRNEVSHGNTEYIFEGCERTWL